jgi:ubiquinone/menaquinone biosynthesis C-methylase UbiE
MKEAMSAEFNTVAEWTAQVAAELGTDYYIPAGCRGSGSPAALDWLINNMALSRGETLLDCGAGVGGPAAYAAQRVSVRRLLVEPQAGAARASRRLFGYPVVRAAGAALPMADQSVDAVWALGVLCTTRQQVELLGELSRVLRTEGRIGLLVFLARDLERGQPDGNFFPTPESLTKLADLAGLKIDARARTADMPAIPHEWQRRAETITAELSRRYGRRRAWQLAEQQADTLGRLLADSAIAGELLVMTRRH